MIFYFSGTGNSEYVARRIAAATGDVVSSIAECVARRRFDFDASKERRVGFVFPFLGLAGDCGGVFRSVDTCGCGVLLCLYRRHLRHVDRTDWLDGSQSVAG